MRGFENWISPANMKPLHKTRGGYSDGENEFLKTTWGAPDFIMPRKLNEIDSLAKSFYEGRAAEYEQNLHLTFKTYNENELEVRSSMVDELLLSPDSRVLEVACGTGRDSELICQRLSSSAELHLVDISEDMLKAAYKKLSALRVDPKIFYCLANAAHLPYPDAYFDAFYSFGALGEFSDPSGFFKEVVRVCKKGAKVVVGDENLPVWQRKTEFGRILANYNSQFLANVPFEALPREARKVKCEWIIGGVFYLISFELGEGDLPGNFEFDIPGIRGGTHKTRYYGQLEGVTLEVKALAERARFKSGKSMHDWLTSAVEKAALEELDGSQ